MTHASTSGLFITFEGGEGVGKSTQVKRLAAWFEAQGRTVVTTREPGGTPNGEQLRDLLVRHRAEPWEALSEVLLNTTVRYEHVCKKIHPALAAGTVVICDRFYDSTVVYQGIAQGQSNPVILQHIEDLHCMVIGDVQPDITFVLDMDVQTALSRATTREQQQNAGENRFEAMDMPFHETIRQGFLTQAHQHPHRCHIIDAAQDAEAVHQAVVTIIQNNQSSLH